MSRASIALVVEKVQDITSELAPLDPLPFTGIYDINKSALDRFCEKTALYSCNAKRFKAIVENVEACNISPERIAKKMHSIINKRKPRFAYAINRNPLLLLLGAMPSQLQFFIIRKILHK